MRLLDFGLARLVLDDDAAQEHLTREGGWALTPEYAAPEQFTGAPLSMATDVFALGVLLYELLTGARPSGLKAAPPLAHLRAATEERYRLASQTVAVSVSVSVSAPALAAALRGDLDNVLARCLHADPAGRYASAAALAADLQRHLLDLPVSARALGWRERAFKFVRRNRGVALASALASTALVLGVVGTVSMALRAREGEALAQAQTQRAQALRDTALAKMGDAQDMAKLFRDVTTALPAGQPFSGADVLARATKAASETAGLAPARRALMLTTIADAYWRQAEIGRAEAVAEQALALVQPLAGTAAWFAVNCSVAQIYSYRKRFAEAQALLRPALAGLQTQPALADEQVHCLLIAADVAFDRGDAAVGLGYAEAARKRLPDLLTLDPEVERVLWSRLANARRQMGQMEGANEAFEQMGRLVQSQGLGQSRARMLLLSNWAGMLNSAGYPRRAKALLDEAALLASGPAGVAQQALPASTWGTRVAVLTQLGELAGAQDALAQALQRAQVEGNVAAASIAQWQGVKLLRAQGRVDAASASLAALAPALRSSYPPQHPVFALIAMERGVHLELQGLVEQAELHYTQAIDLMKAGTGSAADLPSALLRRAQVRLARQQGDAALQDASLADGLLQRSHARLPSRYKGDVQMIFGQLHQAGQRLPQARTAFKEAAAQFARTLGEQHASTLQALRLADGMP